MFFVAALGAALGACEARREPTLPRVTLGKDHCAQCDMVIEDAGSIALVVGTQGPRFYDDPGCLLDDRREHPDIAARPAFVHDADARGPEAWIPLDRAWFVLSPSIRTPMGSELEAHASRERAIARAREVGGEAIGPDAIAQRRVEWRKARYGSSGNP